MTAVFPTPPLVLASASPRRAALLRQAGLSIEVRPVPCDEAVLPGEAAEAYARRIAGAKLDAALTTLGPSLQPDQWVLTADTVVWVAADREPLGKPEDADACAKMLEAIGGPAGHRVTTAWALGRVGADPGLTAETTTVWFRRLHADERDAYLRSDAWRDKAGGYGIQAEAAGWVWRIEGSYTNVVGLPLAQVLERLRAVHP